MNGARKLLLKASEKLELPSDVLVGLPRVELLGTGRCSIEPQRGLLEYSEERICVSTELGHIHILGAKMRIKEMNALRIVISGEIDAVGFAEMRHE